jgi:hypothetical protein
MQVSGNRGSLAERRILMRIKQDSGIDSPLEVLGDASVRLGYITASLGIPQASHHTSAFSALVSRSARKSATLPSGPLWTYLERA